MQETVTSDKANEEPSDSDWLTESETEEAILESEQEDASRTLEDFKEISQKLLDELSILEAEIEREETCCEQAEVYATPVCKENRELKPLNMKAMPMLHELPKALLSEEPQVNDSSADGDNTYQQLIKDLQETNRRLLKEKKETSLDLEEMKRKIRQLNEEIEEERLERKSLVMTLAQNQKMMLQVNKASLHISQEYDKVVLQLEVEQELRQKAESFAHKKLREQQAASRQSMILMQSVDPSVMLLTALEEVRILTTTLEETKQDLQTKIMDLESQLVSRPSRKELELLQGELRTTKEEKSQLGDRLKESEEKRSLLEQKVLILEEKLQEMESVSCNEEEHAVSPAQPPPPPPPPPPLPCMTSKVPENPLDLIKQRRGMKTLQCDQVKRENDVKAQAVKEMMERIKNGVILRSAQSRSAVTSKRKSILNELQGILMVTMKKPPRKSSIRRSSRKVKDSELESVLMRRRRIVEVPPQTEVTEETKSENSDKGANSSVK
ncbi:shootin-1-like [Rhinophrynus dorsalis]